MPPAANPPVEEANDALAAATNPHDPALPPTRPAPSQAPITVLFLSNGHGEDAVGACIADQLAALAPTWQRWAAPIVGDGLMYRRRGLPVVVPTKVMPSGGFVGTQHPDALWQDLRAGLIRLHLRQLVALRRHARHIHLVVGVGDRLVLYLNRWALRRPLYFVAIADSAHLTEGRAISSPAERRLMRETARQVFTRDALSARLLAQDGVPATFAGNPMMDTFAASGTPGADLGLAPGERLIGLLPGSREEAYRNFRIILEGVAALAAAPPTPGLRFMAAWPDALAPERLPAYLEDSGWQLRPAPTAPARGAHLLHTPTATRVELVTGRFGDILHRAVLVIGMAGTANEQAAGLGKPVVTCPGTGPQVTAELVRRQQLLLGEAVWASEPRGEAIAAAVRAILTDPARYRRMAAAGRERMGAPGAARRIAEAIVRFAADHSMASGTS